MRKKLSIGITIALMASTSAAALPFGYAMAMDKFDAKINDFNEKLAMYEKLSELDQYVRQYYQYAIDTDELMSGICHGYINGLNDNQIKYYCKEEYEEYKNQEIPESVITTIKYDDDNVIIRVSGIDENTAEAFEAQVNNTMLVDNPKNLIIDIRDCHGFNIDQTAQMMNMFTPEGELIYSVDSNAQITLLQSSNNVYYKDVNLAVIINENTSGSAELFASAMIDYGRAKIVGQTTAGNLTDNKIIKLRDGSVISIPIANYVTKSQKTLCGKGVQPEKFVSLDSDKYAKLIIGKLDVKDDDQINAAVLLLQNTSTQIFDVVDNPVGEKVESEAPDGAVESTESTSDGTLSTDEQTSSDSITNSKQE